jgi:hypothetical protein
MGFTIFFQSFKFLLYLLFLQTFPVRRAIDMSFESSALAFVKLRLWLKLSLYFVTG